MVLLSTEAHLPPLQRIQRCGLSDADCVTHLAPSPSNTEGFHTRRVSHLIQHLAVCYVDQAACVVGRLASCSNGTHHSTRKQKHFLTRSVFMKLSSHVRRSRKSEGAVGETTAPLVLQLGGFLIIIKGKIGTLRGTFFIQPIHPYFSQTQTFFITDLLVVVTTNTEHLTKTGKT